MIEKRGGIISYLCIQNRAIDRIRTYNHAAWASNSGEEKDSLDHSATGHFIYLKEKTDYCTSNHLGVTRKFMWRFEPPTFTSAVCYANYSAIQTCYIKDIKNRNRITSESNQ